MKPNIEMEYTHNDITYKLKEESLNKYYDFVIYTDGSCTKNWWQRWMRLCYLW